MNKVIVVGANGFIGSRLTKQLSNKGCKVYALVDARFDYSNIRMLDGVECIEFTLDTINSLSGDSRFSDIDVLYHLAWTAVNAKYRNDVDAQLINIPYTLNVLKFCETNKIKKVIVSGSAAEVSCGEGLITDKEVVAPSDMYSATKAASRIISMMYAKQHNIEMVWTLISSIYGPGRDDNNLISYAIKTLLKGEKPSFTGLEQQWDYIFITDLLNALEALGESGHGGKIYPVGSGFHQQMKKYVEIIRDSIDPSLPLGIGDLPYKNPDKIDNQIFDISSLTKDTGFVPQVSFHEGIKQTIDFFKTLKL